MPLFQPGQTVQIRCEVQDGPFPGEYLVTFETTGGPVSGFVRSDNIRYTEGEDHGYIFATIKEVSNDTVTVIARGSFFTTTGLAYLKRDWANSHVVAHA